MAVPYTFQNATSPLVLSQLDADFQFLVDNNVTTARKNLLLNGAMEVDQRNAGTAIALPGVGATVYSLDRWAVSGNAAQGTAQQRDCSAFTTGFRKALVLQRTAANATTTAMIACQALETVDSVRMAGKNVTLSFRARGGANFSGSTLRAIITTGTGTDQSTATLLAGWTGASNIVDSFSTIPVNTSMVAFNITGTVPASATQIGVQFIFTPTGVAGADDTVWITGVQLESGSVATDYEARSFGAEVTLCQRYYEKSYVLSAAVPTNTAVNYDTTFADANVANSSLFGFVRFMVNKRAAPTCRVFSFTLSTVSKVSDALGNDLAANSGVVANPSTRGFQVQNSSGGALVPAVRGLIFHWDASADL